MKDIKGYEGLYAITSCGKVWSYRRKKFLKPSISVDGYLRVQLKNKENIKTIEIHRLVAEAYIPNPEGKKTVNHIDEIKSHNYVGNLEWNTIKENANYGTRTQKISKKSKGKSRIAQKIYCVELERTFNSQQDAVKELGICISSMSKAVNGLRKTAGGYHWKRLEG